MPRKYIHLKEQYFNEIVHFFPLENETENLCFQKETHKIVIATFFKKRLFRNNVDICIYIIVNYQNQSQAFVNTMMVLLKQLIFIACKCTNKMQPFRSFRLSLLILYAFFESIAFLLKIQIMQEQEFSLRLNDQKLNTFIIVLIIIFEILAQHSIFICKNICNFYQSL